MVPSNVKLTEGTSSIGIEYLCNSDITKWDSFVLSHPAGTFFHLFAWSRVLDRVFGHESHYLVAKSGDRIVGVLPLARVRSLIFGDALVSTPFCVYGGVIAESLEISSALENYAAHIANKLSVDFLEIRNRDRVIGNWSSKELYATFRKELPSRPEDMMAEIPRKQRAEIRSGIKNNLLIEIDSDTDRLYDKYSVSLKQLGTPIFSQKYFKVLQEEFGDACEITTVVYQGKSVVSLMSFWFRDEVLPYYVGGLPSARTLSAYDFIYWELMRRAIERGTKIFDFGRSKVDSGPYKYKKHWGFVPASLPYAYHLVRRNTVPNLSPSNSKFYYAIKTWKQLPLPITKLIGPYIAPYLG